MRASENRSNVEVDLESEEPTEMSDDASTSEDDGGRGIVATSVEHHVPATMSASGGWDTKRHGEVPTSRKCAASSDAIGK